MLQIFCELLEYIAEITASCLRFNIKWFCIYGGCRKYQLRKHKPVLFINHILSDMQKKNGTSLSEELRGVFYKHLEKMTAK